MSEPEDDLETHDAHTAGNGSHLIPHPDEGHVRSDPELKELLDEIKRQQPAAAKADDADTPNTA